MNQVEQHLNSQEVKFLYAVNGESVVAAWITDKQKGAKILFLHPRRVWNAPIDQNVTEMTHVGLWGRWMVRKRAKKLLSVASTASLALWENPGLDCAFNIWQRALYQLWLWSCVQFDKLFNSWCKIPSRVCCLWLFTHDTHSNTIIVEKCSINLKTWIAVRTSCAHC